MEKKKKRGHQPSSKPTPEGPPAFIRYSSLAFELTAFNFLVIWGGIKLDELLPNTTIPWFTILGVFLAVAGTIYYLLKRLR